MTKDELWAEYIEHCWSYENYQEKYPTLGVDIWAEEADRIQKAIEDAVREDSHLPTAEQWENHRQSYSGIFWQYQTLYRERDEWKKRAERAEENMLEIAPRPVPETAALTVPIRTTFCWGCHAEGVQPLFESPASHVRIVGDGSAVICGPCGDGYTLSPPAYLDVPPAPPAEPVEARHDVAEALAAHRATHGEPVEDK